VKPTVFIQTNNKQIVGAIVAEYSLKRNSKHADEFDVKFMKTDDYPFLKEAEGEVYLRDGVKRPWYYEDLQSFTPLRFMPPELMNYEGRALVIDPDVFAVTDVWDLLNRDMEGRAVMCRLRSGSKEKRGCNATSVMLLDCAKLTHWNCEQDFKALFEFKRDYAKWMCLQYEAPETVGRLEKEWNDFDKLTPQTRMLHNTKRRTQPWKTGLPVDFTPPEKPAGIPMLGALHRVRRRLFGYYTFLGRYVKHPDPNQERFFFGLLRECLDRGIISEDVIKQEMELKHVRPDALQVLARSEPLAA
jgi:hypothetical protein